MSLNRQARPILITGASSGIGRAATERLAGLGHPVFATARRPADLESLAAIPNVTPVRLDVRDPAQVAAAVGQVRAAGRGLWALVNNAGVGGIGPVAAFRDEEVRDLFDINVLSVFRLTREFLPLLLESAGRVVLVSSQGGSMSMKYFGPYTMTKHALEAFAVALNAEIRPHGAKVAVLQPGGVITAIFDTALEADRERFLRAPSPFDQEAREVAAGLDQFMEFDPTRPESAGNRHPAPPEEVAAVLDGLVNDPEPPLRTLFGTRWEGNRVLDTLMERLVQANACPSLRYSREELIERLDKHLGATDDSRAG